MGTDDEQELGASLARGLGRPEAICWPLKRSDALFELRYGKALVESVRRPGTVPVYGTNGRTGSHDTALFPGPGVIIGRKGAGHLGVEWTDDDFWVIDTAYSLVPLGDIDLKFAYYLIKHVGLDHLKHGTSNPSLTRDAFGAQLFPLPPAEDQRRIAATLTALDDKINSNRRAIAYMEELARAHFDRLFDIDVKHGGVALSTLMRINPKRVLPREELATYVGMAALPEFSAEVYEWEFRPAGSGQRFVNGDVLMARITPCLENGKTAVVDMLEPAKVGWGSTEYVVLAPRGEISTPWIYCLLRSDAIRSFAIRSMSGTSGRQRFQADRFDQYAIARPESGALREFNTIAEPMFVRMTQLRDESVCAQALRDALLPELLSGRIRVPESNDAFTETIA